MSRPLGSYGAGQVVSSGPHQMRPEPACEDSGCCRLGSAGRR
jgi:hypothetical protein